MRIKALLAVTLSLASLGASAAFFKPIYKYILPSGKVVELQDENTRTDTAYYFDYKEGKRVYIKLSEASRQTKQTMNGIKSGDFVSAVTDKGPTICSAWTVFENGMARLGCRTGYIDGHMGPARHVIGQYTADTKNLGAPQDEVNGIKVGSKVMKDGKRLKVFAIFDSGLALVQKDNIFLRLDTSGDLMKTSVEIVDISELN